MIDQVLLTNQVTEEYLDKIQSVKMSPCIFQKRITKNYELRITVAGNKIFPVKIYSQDDQATNLDWRARPKLNDFNVKMEATTIPVSIQNQIRLFMKKLNLRFGCIDIIARLLV
ncbi:MAG TPA: hypothetical protein PLF70_01675 [Candidatus Portnoybacteria bacterium]|nr:hypothetical protein [Candidatus Portnoybacteria bacterium]